MLARLREPLRTAYLFATGIFNGWKDSWTLVARKKAGWAPRRALSQAERERILGDSESCPYAW